MKSNFNAWWLRLFTSGLAAEKRKTSLESWSGKLESPLLLGELIVYFLEVSFWQSNESGKGRSQPRSQSQTDTDTLKIWKSQSSSTSGNITLKVSSTLCWLPGPRFAAKELKVYDAISERVCTKAPPSGICRKITGIGSSGSYTRPVPGPSNVGKI